MATRASDDNVTFTAFRILPFWPTVWGIIGLVAVGGVAAGVNGLQMKIMSEKIAEGSIKQDKIIDKFDQMRMDYFAQKAKSDELERRLTAHDIKIETIERRLK